MPKPLRHIAIIMDGNGRWANARGLKRSDGHRAGAEAVVNLIDPAIDSGIDALSLFAFSTENWSRPQDEVSAIMRYVGLYLRGYLKTMGERGIRLRVSGDISRMPALVRKAVDTAVEATRNNGTLTLNICFGYGGRADIVRAARLMAKGVKEGKISELDITEESFKDYLYTAGMPDVDLMIRTSGEKRISNFMLYQCSYAEYVFTDTLWPDFDGGSLNAAIAEYRSRDRRYGGLTTS